jgi:hypothetical protein
LLRSKAFGAIAKAQSDAIWCDATRNRKKRSTARFSG